jgi:hypothetical protein
MCTPNFFIRFGIIVAVQTKPGVTVKKDDRLFVSYGYSPLQDIPWYREQFIKFKKDYPEMARQVMQNYGIKDRVCFS